MSVELKDHSVASAFGVLAPEEVKAQGYETDENPNVPKRDDFFRFVPEVLREALLWWDSRRAPGRNDGLAISGHTGCGKSTFAEQFFNRLNVPVYSIICFPHTEPADFYGSLGLVNGNTIWQSGPAVKAAKEGGILLVEEGDRLDPTVLGSLAPLMEGKPFRIPGDGRIVEPQGLFGVVMTTNTRGGRDDTGHYDGAKKQNLAVMDRFMGVHVDYPQPEVEEALIDELVLSKVPQRSRARVKQSLSKHVSIANKVRGGFKDPAQGLSVTISTRVLLRWAELSMKRALMMSDDDSNAEVEKPHHRALDLALLNNAPADTQAAIHETMDTVFGYK